MKILIIPAKNLKIGLSVMALILALLLLLALLHPELRAVSSSKRLLPIYGVATSEQKVAISFDASWGAEFTPVILDVLDEYNVKATFFLVNIWVEDYPEMAKEIADRGHELGLHSTSHPHCTKLSPADFAAELKDNYQLIVATTGYQPTLFRPPFGDYNNQVVEIVEQEGFACIQWSVDALDRQKVI